MFNCIMENMTYGREYSDVRYSVLYENPITYSFPDNAI